MRTADRRAKAQLDLFDEIIVDNFAGGGGASTGIELASILTAGENSREAMQNMGYKLLGYLYGRDNWKPKSTLLYSPPEGEINE